MSIKQVDVRGKKVFLRLDLNVPLSEASIITDKMRILASAPTIKYVIENGGRAILSSHLGRPKGKVQSVLSLKPIAEALTSILGKEVPLATDSIGDKVHQMVDAMVNGDVILLENLRFHKGETENDPEFSQALARLGEIYVNDAFGTAHRAHASVSGITQYLNPCVSGLLMEKEIEYLSRLTGAPQRPFIALMGGAKLSDKLGIIENLMEKLDALLIGGGMAYTFLMTKGIEIGRSIVEKDKREVTAAVIKKAEQMGFKLKLTEDHVIARELKDAAKTIIVTAPDMPEEWIALDIGPRTIELFCREIADAKTILWNGPMGVFELDPFGEGTKAIGKAIAGSDAVSVICGGDTVAAVTQMGLADEMTHISTGGGAALEFLEGKDLPGIASLDDA